MRWILAIAFAGWIPAAFAEAPFCAVTPMGSQCHYYTLSACRQAVVGLDGSCVVNPGAVSPAPSQSQAPPTRTYPAPTVQAPNVFGSFLQGVQAGQQARQAREEHEARMVAAQAETAEIQRRSTPQAPAPVIDTGTAQGLAQACAYLRKVGDPQWTPASQDETVLGLGFAMECKGFITGLVGGITAVPNGAGASAPFCLDSSANVSEVAAALAAGTSVLPGSADQAALPYALGVLGARWKCSPP